MNDDFLIEQEESLEPKSIQKIKVTYSEFEEMMKELVTVLYPNRHEYACVHGLPRGGLSIAVHLSHYLQLPLMMNVTQFSTEFPNRKLLVVDDIIDTGRTFERFLEIAKLKNIKYDTAVLYYKPNSSYYPSYHLKETDDWICFPWEVYEEIPNREKYEPLGGTIDSSDTDLDLNIL